MRLGSGPAAKENLMKKMLAFVGLAALTLSSVSAQTVKIGTIQPITGKIAVYGKAVSQAVTLAVEEANAKGGVNGKKIELITEDDAFNPDNTVAAFKKLVTKDKVLAVVGALTSNCTLAITNLAQAAKIPLITPTSTNDKVTDAGNYIFRACYKDSFQGKVVGQFAANTLKAKVAGVLFDKANDYSFGLKSNFEAAFVAAGGKVVSESYTGDTKDFNAQIANIKAAKPDVIFLPDYYNTVALLSKQLRAAGLTQPLLGADGWDDAIGTGQTELVGSYYSNHYSPDVGTDASKAFVAAYKARWNGESPNALAALGYDSTKMLIQALIAADSAKNLNSPGVRDALAAVKGSYVTGNISFDSTNNPVKSAVVLEIVKGDDGKLATKYKTTVNP
jgi:branched-chain amino acid transport system substrate-binding protein